MNKPKNIFWQAFDTSKAGNFYSKKNNPLCVWLTGLSGAGKSTIAKNLALKLAEAGTHTYVLDGDNLRHGLNKDLGFSEADRSENIRRVGEVAKLMVDARVVVIVSVISPFANNRKLVRSLFSEGQFVEVFVDASLEECEKRDPKGLYKKARNGEISDFTGIDSPYEVPLKPEIIVNTETLSAKNAAELIFEHLSGDLYEEK